MAIQKTAIHQLPWPDHNEKLANIWANIRDLAQAADTQMVIVATDAADLSVKVPAPVAGQIAVLTTTQQILLRTATVWQQVFPLSPGVLSGSAAPASTLGNVGDIYLQY